jgi:hypothetical protein
LFFHSLSEYEPAVSWYTLPSLLFLFSFIVSSLSILIYNVFTMYLEYFNEKKPWVPKVPRVSWHTANFMGRYVPVPSTGTVWETPTHGIPALNPIRDPAPSCQAVELIRNSRYCKVNGHTWIYGVLWTAMWLPLWVIFEGQWDETTSPRPPWLWLKITTRRPELVAKLEDKCTTTSRSGILLWRITRY